MSTENVPSGVREVLNDKDCPKALGNQGVGCPKLAEVGKQRKDGEGGGRKKSLSNATEELEKRLPED